MMASQQLGNQLKAARNKAGLSLRRLATLTRIPATTIAGYEKGNKIPADSFLRIADVLQHHAYEVDGNLFRVGRMDSPPGASERVEQLKLDFSAEYNYSVASVRIGPGKITVSFEAVTTQIKALMPRTTAT